MDDVHFLIGRGAACGMSSKNAVITISWAPKTVTCGECKKVIEHAKRTYKLVRESKKQGAEKKRNEAPAGATANGNNGDSGPDRMDRK